MLRQFVTAVRVFVLLTILTGVFYPLAVSGIAWLGFPLEAHGSLIVEEGKIVGSSLIGQQFDDPKYFWGRLSATGPVPYNGASSSGSNLGPLNPALRDSIDQRVQALHDADPDLQGPIPVDLITASGSGLDPEISPAAAAIQVRRVAAARKMSEKEVAELIDRHRRSRQFGVLGEPRVNVLQLNLALDSRSKRGS